MYAKFLKEILSKKRRLEDHEIVAIIDVKRGMLTFEVWDERIEFRMISLLKDPYRMVSWCLVDVINTCAKAKPEQQILRVEVKPPPQIQKYESPYRKKKNKSNGYERSLDRWTWIPKLKIEGSTLRESPWVIALMDNRVKRL